MTQDIRRISGMLGLARRAGKLTVGVEQVCLSMAKQGDKRPCLVLLSHTASDLTKKKVTAKCEFYGLPLRQIDIDTVELGRLLGKQTTPAAVAVHDVHMADEIERACGSVTIATKG